MSMTARPLAACAFALAVLAAGCGDDEGGAPPAAPAAPTITTQPADVTATEGDWVTFTVDATGGALEYSWEGSPDGGANWYALPYGEASLYLLMGTDLADNGLLFRCVVSGAGGEVTSDIALLTVQPDTPAVTAPSITAQPADVTVTEGDRVTFTVAATGDALEYEWQRSTDGGTTWFPLAWGAWDTFTIEGATLADDGLQLQCVVSNAGGTITSDVATLTVQRMDAPVVTTQPADVTATEGEWVTFTVAATGEALVYEWQHSTDSGTTWFPLAWGSESSYTLDGVALEEDGLMLKCLVSNSGGDAISDGATLTVQPIGAGTPAPVITTHPADAMGVPEGSSVTFTVAATGEYLDFQWLLSTDAGFTWFQAPWGGTSDTYRFEGVLPAHVGLMVRCRVSNPGGEVVSDTARIGDVFNESVVFVDAGATGAGDGSSWDDAFADLQDALAAASSGREIWVAAGTYVPGTARADTFQLVSGADLYGGFAGGEDARGRRDFAMNVTTLSGDTGGNDDPTKLPSNPLRMNGENSYHVVTGADNALLDGFTIAAGNANGAADSEMVGGGVYCDAVSATVANCTFDSNGAVSGGGFCSTGGACEVTYCTFTSNAAGNGGGGLIFYDTSVATNCEFIGNSAAKGAGIYLHFADASVTSCTFKSGSATFGGGISSFTSNLTILDCTFESNAATEGGGMYNDTSSPTVTNCTFISNSANYGGGMCNNASDPTVTDCTFNSNSAFNGGGMINYNASSPTIANCAFGLNSATVGSITRGGGMSNLNSSNPAVTNCTFISNSATATVFAEGGGMYNYNANPTVTNCTFISNSGSDGGGMHNNGSAPAVTNCTFNSNHASWGGGAMCNYESSNPTIRNCILWMDTAARFNNEISSSITAAVSYSCVRGGYAGTGNIGADLVNDDPLFVDAAGGDLRLSSGSPCIDKGSNAAVPAGVTTDLGGDPRIVDGDGLDTDSSGDSDYAEVDMGAYEYQ